MPDDERLAVGLEEVDEAVRRADEGRRPGDDRLEEVVRVVPVHQRDGRLVERREIRVAAASASSSRRDDDGFAR